MFDYFGGKSGAGTYQTIINQIPTHDVYFEPFLGMGGILRHKKPAQQSFGFDLNSACIDASTKWGFGPGLTVKNTCAISFLEGEAQALGPESFIYLDPPYPLESRKSNKPVYDFELSDQEHARILAAIKTLDCNIAISTYPNGLYDKELGTWRKIEFQSMTRRGLSTEILFMNYTEGLPLHDDQYLGENSQTRQDIKRKLERKTKGVLKLPAAERLRFLRQLAEALPDSEKQFLVDSIAPRQNRL